MAIKVRNKSAPDYTFLFFYSQIKIQWTFEVTNVGTGHHQATNQDQDKTQFCQNIQFNWWWNVCQRPDQTTKRYKSNNEYYINRKTSQVIWKWWLKQNLIILHILFSSTCFTLYQPSLYLLFLNLCSCQLWPLHVHGRTNLSNRPFIYMSLVIQSSLNLSLKMNCNI